MMIVLMWGILGVGPTLDPIVGEQVTQVEREILPSERSVGGIADMWLLSTISQQIAGAGIANFDPMYLSAHGRSWTQQHYFINALDITDPARSGLPIVQVPHDAWDTLTARSLFTATPGFAWTLMPQQEAPLRARLSYGRDVGGPLLLPRSVFDGEPPFAKRQNPPNERRALRAALEAAAHSDFATPWGAWRVGFEHIEHNHRYVTLPVRDRARRTTGLVAGHLQLGGLPVETFVLTQLQRRSHEGAQWRWPEPLTARSAAAAMVAGMSTMWRLTADTSMFLQLGGGFRADDDRLRSSQQAIVTDLENEWRWMQRREPPENIKRGFWHASLALRWDEPQGGWPAEVALTARQGIVSRTPSVPQQRIGTTYAGRGVLQTIYDAVPPARESLTSTRLQGTWLLEGGGAQWQMIGALDYGSVGDTALRAWHISPAAGVAARWPLAYGSELFGLLRREPDVLTSEVAQFLNPQTPSGRRSVWTDDGDLLPEAGEEGAVVMRTGGKFHRAVAGLRRPSSQMFAVGYRTPAFGPFHIVMTGSTRWLIDRYTVRYAPGTATFTSRGFHDPGGDGRGENNVPGGGQDFTVYARELGAAGNEIYELTNAGRPDFYFGSDVQIKSRADAWWFLSFSASAYFSAGSAPSGNFADRNDPGIISEDSADPNLRLNARGRYDHDRAFGLKLLAGVRSENGFSAAVAARYRDGQPFSRVVVVTDLPQGPVPLMGVRRGKARHTYAMTFDGRLRFAIIDAVAVVLDMYNMFGEGVEILEDNRTGPNFRNALEQIPHRAVLLSLELG